MEPQTFTRTRTTEITFIPMELHPGLVHTELASEQDNGEVTAKEFLLRQTAVDAAITSGDPIACVKRLTGSLLSGDLNDASLYNLVPAAWLTQPFNKTLHAWSHDELSFAKRAGLEGYVPLHMNFYDHTLWDMAGKQVMVPVDVEMWGSLLDLDAVAEHIKDDPRVISFEIVRNPVGQNHDISGKCLGQLRVHLTDEDCALLHEVSGRPVSPQDIQDLVVNCSKGGAGDVLGISPYLIRRLAKT